MLGINQDKKESKKKDDNLQRQIDAIVSDVSSLYSLVGDVNENQDSLSQAIAVNVANLAELESEKRIVEFIDPCGDKPNAFDEILMVTSEGDYVAYFQSGSKRFLTVLPNGNFRTTDSQRCNFSIVNGEYVE